jgi:hypothetical protein
MKEEYLHATDEQLLLYAGEELRSASSSQIHAHLECCSACRDRLIKLESTLAEFSDAHRETWNAELPSAEQSRARLQSRLAAAAAQAPAHGIAGKAKAGDGWLPAAWASLVRHRQPLALSAALIACLLLAVRFRAAVDKSPPALASLGPWEEPNVRLTPGATIPATENDVCGTKAASAEPAVPVSLTRKVFELYGVIPSRPDAYQVDYLISPRLGGAIDIRNLWPEPNQNAVWNAQVKDQLEDRLHNMVCHGDVDLATAQHDISTDWIAAYRKYFHADKPVAKNSSAVPSRTGRFLPVT